MSYTSDEKDLAVQKLVQGRMAFTRDRLGPRDVGNSYAQLSELVNSSLFYEPDGIFYLIYLSSNYYTRSVSSQLTLIDELLDAIDDLLKPNKPVNDVSSLGSAKQALLGIDSALSRDGAVGDREFQRYTKSIDQARESLGRAVKLAHIPRGGSQQVTEIVRPQAQAKSIVAQRFASISTGHASLLEAVTQMLSAYEEFLQAPLSSKIAQRQVIRAANELDALQSELEPLSPRARVERARDGLLTILANKATVKALANRITPGAPKVEQQVGATAEYRLTAYGSGAAPTIQGTNTGPWDLEYNASDILNFDINGTTGINVDLNLNSPGYVEGATRVEVLGGSPGPFAVSADLSAPHPLRTQDVTTGGNYLVNGKQLFINVDGNPLKVPASPWGADKTAAQVRDDINAAIGGYVTASVVTGGGNDYVKIVWNNTTNPPDRYGSRYMQIATGIANADDLGPWEVLYADPTSTPGTLTRGWDANNQLLVRAGDATSPTTITLTSGSWPDYTRTAAQVASDITGTGFAATTDGDNVLIYSTAVGSGAYLQIQSGGLRLVGSRAGFGTASHLGMQMLGFSEGQEDRNAGVDVRAVVNTLNNHSGFNAEAQASAVRDVLLKTNNAIYAASNELDISLPKYDTDPTDGWDFSTVKMEIHSGDNRGLYELASSSWNPTTHVLTLTLDTRTLRDTSTDNRHQITVFQEFLKIDSLDSSTTGSLKVNNVADTAHVLIGLPTTEVISTVLEVLVEYNDPLLGWRAADLTRKHIKVGDKILDGSGTEAATITSISNVSLGRLGVTSVAADLDLSAGFTVESAAFRAYNAFEEALTAWQEDTLPPYEEDLAEIDKKLNYVLNIDSPSQGQVNNAYSAVDDLKTKMESLKTVMDDFSTPSVPALDKAMSSLLEHGNDRARELLLKSKISDYFGTTSSEASYSRALMKAASVVTVEDLNQTTNMGEDRDEFDRYAGGWVDEYDPAYLFEDEDELPEPAITSFWPELENP